MSNIPTGEPSQICFIKQSCFRYLILKKSMWCSGWNPFSPVADVKNGQNHQPPHKHMNSASVFVGKYHTDQLTPRSWTRSWRPQWWHWGIMIGMTTAIGNHLQNWFETVKRYTFLLMLLVSERMKFKIIKHQGWCHVEMFEMRPVGCSFLEFSRPVCYQVTCWHLRRFSIIFWWVLFCWLELCKRCSFEAITASGEMRI